LVTAGCDREGFGRDDAARCTAACTEKSQEADRSACGTERRAYLGCVSTARVDCRSLHSSPAVSIEHRQAILGCGDEHGKLEQCLAPCRQAGAEHLVDRSVTLFDRTQRVQARLVRAGCAPCRDTESGAPAGSPCQASSVCSEVCCSCPDGRASFVARVCADAVCAGKDACVLGRAAGPDPCAPAQPR